MLYLKSDYNYVIIPDCLIQMFSYIKIYNIFKSIIYIGF
jgi:hypothetical protein